MIRQAHFSDLASVTQLALQLWPGHSQEELAAEMAEILQSPDAAIFLSGGDSPTGFAQCQLRRDYVEGTKSSPVGYLEGIYVVPACRGQGIGRRLLAACEVWAKDRGCKEFASDCELDNSPSLAFHQKVGFQEANRIICFTKQL